METEKTKDPVERIAQLLEQHKSALILKVDDEVVKLRQENSALNARLIEIENAARKSRINVPGLEDEKQKFSFFKAVMAIQSRNWDNAGFEKEVFDATRKTMAALGGGTAGGYIVPTIYIPELIEMLSAESVVASMGATFLRDLQGSPIQIPKQLTGSTAYWVGENTSITASDLTFGQISLTPKKVGALVKLSNTLLKLSNPSAEALVRRDIALSLALKIDYGALRDSGANKPTGILGTANINTVAIGADGGNLTFDNIIDMEYALAEDNALRGNLGYIFHPAIRRKFLKTKVAHYSGQTADMEYLIPPMTETTLKGYLGYPYKMTTQIPIDLTKGNGTALTEVYYGNWAEFIIGQWGGMEIMASNETSDAFEKDQTWVRVLQEVDFAVRHPESFCVISDAKAT
jgi:HK97 family phage major capsid protein